MFPQGLQQCPQMNSMFISGLGVYQDIIYEHYHKSVEIESEDSIHEIYKGHKGIGQAKGHHSEFVVTIVGPERSFEDIFRFNPELLVSRLQVNLRKDSCSL